MMDPTREPWLEPTAPSDDAVVAFLRTRAPGLPTVQFDTRAVTARARGALRRRRLRNSVLAAACASIVYLGLALAGPVPVPGVGTVTVPGSQALRAMVADVIPGRPPGPDEWSDDVDSIEKYLLPVLDQLQVTYYLDDEAGSCRIMKYSRGDFSDQSHCEEMTPFDEQAAADFNRVRRAVERSGLPVERLGRELGGGYYVRLKDSSWQYNYQYVSLPGADAPPPKNFPEEEWTRIRGDWWFFRAHDD
jgi:hypothetical protein